MTSRGVASGGVQEGHPDQQEPMDGRAEPGRNDDARESNPEDLSPVAGPALPQAYNGSGRLVPVPALPAVDLTI